MIARGSCLLYVRVRIVQALTRRLMVCHGEAVSLLHGRGVERHGHPNGEGHLEAVIIDLLEPEPKDGDDRRAAPR